MDVARWYEEAYRPTLGEVADAKEVAPAPSGDLVAFTGVVRHDLSQSSEQNVYLLDLASGRKRLVHAGTSTHAAAWSPDGRFLAFLADVGDMRLAQPWVAAVAQLEARRQVADVEGTVEYLSWSPDGQLLLCAVASHGAEHAGAAGSGRVAHPGARRRDMDARRAAQPEPASERYLQVVNPADGRSARVSPAGMNVWEAAWCGPHKVAALVSDDPAEAAWYDARIVLVDLVSGDVKTLYDPPPRFGVPHQRGLLAGDRQGRFLGFVEGICSDRTLVAGDICLFDLASGQFDRIEQETDITSISWTSDDNLLYAGLRGTTSIIGFIEIASLTPKDIWSSEGFAGGGRRFPVAVAGAANDFFTLHESFSEPCAVLLLRNGAARQVFSSASLAASPRLDRVRSETVTWHSSDGIAMNGLLTRPNGVKSKGLIVWLHGGPVSVSSNQWSARHSTLAYLLAQGFTVFRPNPHGSVGTGRDSIAALVGGMGTVDACDVMTGIEHIFRSGLVEPMKVGVGGESYGGFLAAWLVTQTSRFAAGVASAPITDWRSFKRDSNIARFAEIFLGGADEEARSPLALAKNVTTPMLSIVGSLDRCTPANEGWQWHKALENNQRVPSEFVEYPNIGHVPRDFPEVIRYEQAISDWFNRHL